MIDLLLILGVDCVKGESILRVDQWIVIKILLTELCDESSTIASERIRSLDQNTLLEVVRSGWVQFVVADCGLKLKWFAGMALVESSSLACESSATHGSFTIPSSSHCSER